jgi:hypothetical protein
VTERVSPAIRPLHPKFQDRFAPVEELDEMFCGDEFIWNPLAKTAVPTPARSRAMTAIEAIEVVFIEPTSHVVSIRFGDFRNLIANPQTRA